MIQSVALLICLFPQGNRWMALEVNGLADPAARDTLLISRHSQIRLRDATPINFSFDNSRLYLRAGNSIELLDVSTMKSRPFFTLPKDLHGSKSLAVGKLQLIASDRFGSIWLHSNQSTKRWKTKSQLESLVRSKIDMQWKLRVAPSQIESMFIVDVASQSRFEQGSAEAPLRESYLVNTKTEHVTHVPGSVFGLLGQNNALVLDRVKTNGATNTRAFLINYVSGKRRDLGECDYACVLGSGISLLRRNGQNTEITIVSLPNLNTVWSKALPSKISIYMMVGS